MKVWLSMLVLAIGVANSHSALAWGHTGHRSIALLAEQYLNADARAAITDIIGADNHLWELSTWPDEIRSDRRTWGYTFPWHYISIDDHEDIHGEFPRSSRGDVLLALDEMLVKIADTSLSREERWQALAFYVHFVGDIHQPLHVGNRQDRGGNSVRVKWFGQSSNLHSVWDSKIIDHWGLSFSELSDSLDQHIDLSENEGARASHIEWAEESKNLRDQCYQRLDADDGEQPDLGYEYAYYNTDLIIDRLRVAGYRLASKLNDAFAK